MDKQYAQIYTDLEAHHWWWRARRRIIQAILMPQLQALTSLPKLLEVGCASGANLVPFAKLCQVTGIELDENLRQQAWHNYDVHVVDGYLPDGLPEGIGLFDIVMALDVLEHVEDDMQACQTLFDVLKPQGWLLVTVPANPWLWSEFDELNGHYRRYTKRELAALLQHNGYVIDTLSFFNFFLFWPILVSRWKDRLITRADSLVDAIPSIPPPWLNRLLEGIFASEQYWLPKWRFPIGVSLICLAYKPAAAEAAPVLRGF